MENSHDLDWKQIRYALQPKRILFIDQPSEWVEFLNSYEENRNEYHDFTSEQLCTRFLQRVLTKIYQYELNEQELCVLRLIDLHPNFGQTEIGYKKIEEQEKIDLRNNELNVRTSIMKDAGNDLNCQVVLTATDQPTKFQLSAENAAILSIFLSSDSDLANCERLTNIEILRRLHKNRSIDMSLSDVIEKATSILELREAIVNLVRTSMMSLENF
ncbi:uncharacterized protein LOC106087802 [Stomoxys calcitrans]|uniref:uncharacterized protein LOC106087802 n=1 Tax=Stomoxys calcitrans TaxID=35570 RepID=UPI0027E29EAD|nr:uncharacterized protein LOC106087802 [Stomoxys calcitrans]